MNIQKTLAAFILTALTVSLVIFGLKLNKKSEEFLHQEDVCIQPKDPCYTQAISPFNIDTPCRAVCWISINKHLFIPTCFPTSDHLE